MENIREILDSKQKKPLRLWLLLGSTLAIISVSALVYSRVTYEKALEVDNTGGVTGGSGSTGATPLAGTILILATLALVISPTIFLFLREANKHASESRGPLPTSPEPTLSEEEGWEESPGKEDDEESGTTA